MNIRLAWDFDLESYKSLFPEIKLLEWGRDFGTTIDLLVFPGGEDVSLEYYMAGGDEFRRLLPQCHSNRLRDEHELEILDACYDGRIHVNKILGICRGLQFLNVMNGGKLFVDLPSMKVGHSNTHSLIHKIPNNLEFFTEVNSLHHQGIRTLGSSNRRGNRAYPIVVSAETNTGIPEIVTWENNKVLALQFHPEYFDDEFEGKKLFIDFCNDWIINNKQIIKGEK